MAAATQRKSSRMIAAEKSKAVGQLRVLPAGEELDFAAQQELYAADEVGPAAMSEPVSQSAPASQSGGAAQGGGLSQSGGGGGGLKPTNTIPPPPAKPPAVNVSLGGGGGGSLGNKFSSGSTPRDGDPDVSYAFQVTINNETSGMFSEVGGLS